VPQRDYFTDKNGKPLTGRAREKAAEQRAWAILKIEGDRQAKEGTAAYDGEYGAGKLTKHQRRSQEKHIPLVPQDRSTWGKIKRNLF